MADKGKKAKVEEDESSEQVDNELVLAIESLQEVQEKLEKVNEDASDKVLEVEQKYNEIRRPIYDKRNEIIKTIPDFWLTAFLSHPTLCDVLVGEDQKVFKYLESMDVEDFKDVKSGYSITFTFKPNPYFEDSKLTKVLKFSDDGTTSISGTKPRWKDGMDWTNGAATEKEGNKRPFSVDSFFKWFDDVGRKELSEDFHDEIAETIKEDLWPNPLKYFNNEADDDEDEDGEEGDDEDEEGKDDDEDDDGDDDEDELDDE